MAAEGLVKKEMGKKEGGKEEEGGGKREGQQGRLTFTSLEIFGSFPNTPNRGAPGKAKGLDSSKRLFV